MMYEVEVYFDVNAEYRHEKGCYRARLRGVEHIQATGPSMTEAYLACIQVATGMPGYPSDLGKYRQVRPD